MSTFVPELGPATDPNAVSPPDPAYATCPDCGASLEDAVMVRHDCGAGFLASHEYEVRYYCECAPWFRMYELTR